MKKSTLAVALWGVCGACFITPAQALDIDGSFSPAIWNYKEMMNPVPGLPAATPMSATVSGMAWLLEFGAKQRFMEDWSVGLRAEILNTMPNRDEISRVGGNTVQNLFSMSQAELRGEVMYHLPDFSNGFAVGAWAAWQDDLQWRTNHKVNGLPAAFSPLAADPARTTVQVTWLGVSAQINPMQQQLHLRLDVGFPLATKVVYDVYPGETFTNNQNLRYKLSADYDVAAAWENGMKTLLTASYRFRELGNEVRPAAVWPKNQLRIFSLGVRQSW